MEESTIGSICVIAGPPGSGKTTLANQLKELVQGPVLYIEGDRFFSFISNEGSIDRKTSFKATMMATLGAAVPYALVGYQVFVDHCISPRFLKRAYEMTRRRSIPLELIVLYPEETVCAERAATRKYDTIDNYEELHDFYLRFQEAPQKCLVGELMTVQEMAVFIQEERRKKRFLISESDLMEAFVQTQIS